MFTSVTELGRTEGRGKKLIACNLKKWGKSLNSFKIFPIAEI